jgi:hypothetical protein
MRCSKLSFQIAGRSWPASTLLLVLSTWFCAPAHAQSYPDREADRWRNVIWSANIQMQ